MTIATDLISALRETLGPAEPLIHTAIPTARLGGAADVIEFRHAPGGGVLYVTAGAAPELAIRTREPVAWAPSFISRLATAGRKFIAGGTTPLGDGEIDGVLFCRDLPPVQANDRYTQFLLAMTITTSELAACRSHGTAAVVALLRRAGVFPYSTPRRPAVDLAALGPSPRDCPGLSERAARGLAAVIDTQYEAVEGLRARFSEADLSLLASVYPRLGSFAQRAELVNLTQDSLDPCLHDMWRAVLRDALAANIEESTSEHGALAVALSGLDGDHEAFMTYWNDLERALAEAKRRTS